MSAASSDEAAAPIPVRSLPTLLGDYLSLTKPRIVFLLVLTALAAMPPAAHGLPRALAAFAVAAGGALAAGGAHAFNCWFDRDIDAAMHRTRGRPIPDGRIPPWHALAIAVALELAAFGVLAAGANLTAACLAIGGAAIYVLVYTAWLKRSTPQNIVIGGAAGAIPPLVGWAAVTGGLDATALSLFAFVFLWTPPHFWSLAQMIGDDYSRARVPMMPIVAGAQAAKRRSSVYAALAAVAALVPFFTGAAGQVYLIGAATLGIAFVAITMLDLQGPRWTPRVFRFSLVYMAGLFVLLALAPFTP